MMNDPIGMIFFCSAGVAWLVYPLVATKTSLGPERTARGLKLPAGISLARVALNVLDSCVFEDLSSGLQGSAAQSGDVAGGIASGTDLIDHATVING